MVGVGPYEPGDGDGAGWKVHTLLGGKSAFSATSSSGRRVTPVEHSPRGAPATPLLYGANHAVIEYPPAGRTSGPEPYPPP
jgi:hypothetical protein